ERIAAAQTGPTGAAARRRRRRPEVRSIALLEPGVRWDDSRILLTDAVAADRALAHRPWIATRRGDRRQSTGWALGLHIRDGAVRVGVARLDRLIHGAVATAVHDDGFRPKSATIGRRSVHVARHSVVVRDFVEAGAVG